MPDNRTDKLVRIAPDAYALAVELARVTRRTLREAIAIAIEEAAEREPRIAKPEPRQ